MENLDINPKSVFLLEDNTSKKSSNTSYRGFVSIDQEMGREIAMTFFNPSKKSVCSQKGFLFIKN